MNKAGSKGMIGFDRSEPMLLPQRASTIHGFKPNGADITLVCTTREGGTFYCKDDQPTRHIRATEMVATRLAGHLNISTPFCSVIELDDGSTLFGSLGNESAVDGFTVQNFLSQPQSDGPTGPSTWLRRMLASLYVFDLFIGNPDRSFQNFLIERDTRRLCAYDFAAAQLGSLSHQRFPIESSHTILVGKFLRDVHGYEPAYALEMIDRISAVPVDVIRMILSEMPNDWLPTDQRGDLCEGWINQRPLRLSALRAGLTDGTLL